MVMMFFYSHLKRLAYPLLLLSILLLAAVLVPGIGHRAGGSMRWLKFQSFSFQPSEFAKLGLIIFLAYFLTKKEDKIRSFSFAFLPTVLLSGLVIALVGKEPDFGAAFFLTVMVFLLLFVSGARVIYIFSACLAAFPVAYYLLTNVAYRYKRLLSFIRPWEDPKARASRLSNLPPSVQEVSSAWSGRRKAETLLSAPTPTLSFNHWRRIGLVGAMIIIPLHLTVRGLHIALSWGRFGAYLALGITLMIPFSPDQYGRGVGTSPDKRVDTPVHQLRRNVFDHQFGRGGNSSPPFDHDGTEMRWLIAGGGTGGHLFPGMAIAEAFLEKEMGNEVLFVGTEKGIEARALTGRFPLRTIHVSPLKGKSPLGQAKALWAIPKAVREALTILKEFRPQLVVGVGGYASGPALLAASLLGIKRAIQEQNVVPGMTNRMLRWFSQRIFVSFEETKKYFPEGKTIVSGNPVRKEISRCTPERIEENERCFTLLSEEG
jgi:hypothetical protein